MRKALLAAAAAVCASSPADAQSAREFQLQTVVITATHFVGGGLGGAVSSGGRSRLAVSVDIGDLEGEFGGRAAAVVTYHLQPHKRNGVGPYAGGGVSVLAASRGTQEYLVILVGVETSPGASRSWFVEAGVTGGAFVTAGLRLRWRSSPR